jgi:hypothetical protein
MRAGKSAGRQQREPSSRQRQAVLRRSAAYPNGCVGELLGQAMCAIRQDCSWCPVQKLFVASQACLVQWRPDQMQAEAVTVGILQLLLVNDVFCNV